MGLKYRTLFYNDAVPSVSNSLVDGELGTPEEEAQYFVPPIYFDWGALDGVDSPLVPFAVLFREPGRWMARRVVQ